MSDVVTRDSPVPLYRQVKGWLATRLDAGELSPGDRVPSENALAAQHGVSRITARQALQELEAEGRLVRIVGKGTFVAEESTIRRDTRLTGFGENMRAMSRVPSYRLIDMSEIQPDEVVGDRLALDPGEHVFRIVRLLLADDEPVAVAESFLPSTLLRSTGVDLTDETLGRGSLYGFLENQVGVHLTRALEEVEPVLASSAHEALLGAGVGDLLLSVTRTTFDNYGRPVELVVIRYLPSRYRYQTELFRNRSGSDGPVGP